MKIYDEKHIKNIVLLGAPKAGKTLLAEDMIFEAGITHRRGTIDGKNTVSDFHEIEQERGNSVFASSMHTEWRDYKINIIDTPGFDDFIGEMIASVRVADTCVMVINAQYGVEVGTELIWNYIDRFQKPVIFAVNLPASHLHPVCLSQNIFPLIFHHSLQPFPPAHCGVFRPVLFRKQG